MYKNFHLEVLFIDTKREQLVASEALKLNEIK